MPVITRLITASLIVLSLLTSACAPPLLVAGAAGAAGAVVISDPRPAEVVVEDQQIEADAADAINDDQQLREGVRVAVTSFNHIVLLTGRVTDQSAVGRVVEQVRKIDKVRSVHNHIEIGEPASFGQRSRDALLATRIKSLLLGEEGLSSIHVKVVVDNGVVYLMGLVKRDIAQRIARVAQQADGVKRVVLAFEYVS